MAMVEASDNPAPEAAPLATTPATRRAQNLLLLLILACVTAGVVGVVWLFILPKPSKSDHDHVTQWPTRFDLEPWESHAADHDAALAKMHELADALLSFRDSHGGGVRWPMALNELQYAGLLAPDFDFTGVLSGNEIVFQPEMPPAHDPARWVMVYDVELGWMRSQFQPRPYRGMRAVAAIMADGEVKLIDGQDIGMYGGLTVQEVRR